MNVREAKDFLVQQTVEQALLEHVTFSDLEKRMMYFTEADEMTEDPIALNEAFETEYDSAEYERKVSRLMRNAHKRIKRENSQSARTWDESIRELSKGDHYLLVLLGPSSFGYPPGRKLFGSSFWKLLGLGLLTLILALIIFAVVLHRADSIPPSAHPEKFPSQVKYVLFGFAIVIYLVAAFLPGWVGKAYWWISQFFERKKTQKT